MRQGRNFEMLRMFRFQGWRSLRGACSQTGRFRTSRDSALRLDVAVKAGP